MLIYWGIFLVLATGALLSGKAQEKRSPLIFFVLAAIPTALMIGLRWKIGPDWGSYILIYKYTGLISFWDAATHEDPAFYIMNWLLQEVRAPFWCVNLVCGLVFTAGLAAFCTRQPNAWLAFLVAFPYLVIVVGMSGIRQSAAIGLLCFALNAYEQNRLGRATLLIVAAALFHASALLMAPLCALSFSRNRLLQSLILIAVLVIAWLFFVRSFGGYADRYSSARIQSAGIWYRLAMNTLPAVIFLLYQRGFKLDETQRLFWRNMSLATLALFPLAVILPSNTAVDRFVLYLFPLQLFVLPRLDQVTASSRSVVVTTTIPVIAYAAIVQLVFLEFATYGSFYNPYRSILDRPAGP